MSDRPKTRVLLVDDHTLVRAGIRKLLEAIPEVEVVGEAGTGREALAGMRQFGPDVVVMDIGMPDMNGLEATALMRAEKPLVKVLILSMHRADEYVLEAMRVGAAGYLLKESATAELGLAIEAASRGEKYLSPAVSGAIVRSAMAPGETPPPGAAAGLVTNASEASAKLTPRQRDILRRIAAGGSTLRDFRAADGTSGYFQHRFAVYDREDEPCPTPGCKGTIKRIVQSGRSSFFCPTCQH